MKATKVTRKVDCLGRVILPIELRRTLDLMGSNSLELFVEGNSIFLKKYEPGCTFCGNAKDISSYKGRNICARCRKQLKDIGNE